MKEIELITDYVLSMLAKNQYTKLKYNLEALKTALPYIDYFKKDAFLEEYLKIVEETENA